MNDTTTPTPTPITDERKASFALDTIRQLETKLAAVTEQRDEALSDLEFRRDLYSLQTKQLDDVREQRDRLAEAIRKHKFDDVKLWQALQSINPDHTVAANDMIPAVKGGSDE